MSILDSLNDLISEKVESQIDELKDNAIKAFKKKLKLGEVIIDLTDGNVRSKFLTDSADMITSFTTQKRDQLLDDIMKYTEGAGNPLSKSEMDMIKDSMYLITKSVTMLSSSAYTVFSGIIDVDKLSINTTNMLKIGDTIGDFEAFITRVKFSIKHSIASIINILVKHIDNAAEELRDKVIEYGKDLVVTIGSGLVKSALIAL